MTFSEILAEIILEVGGDITDTDFATRLLVFFKTGLRRIPTYIRDRLFLGEDTLSLIVGADTLDLGDLDPGFVRERVIWYVDTSGQRVIIQSPPSIEFFHSIKNSNNSGKPTYYRIYGSTIQFDKKADEALTVGFDYVAEVSATSQLELEGGGVVLNTDGGSVELTTDSDFFGHEQLVEAAKDFCKMTYYRDYEEDEVKATAHERTGKELISELEAEYEIRELGGYVSSSEGDY